MIEIRLLWHPVSVNNRLLDDRAIGQGNVPLEVAFTGVVDDASSSRPETLSAKVSRRTTG